MNPYINIALIAWTLFLAFYAFQLAADLFGRGIYRKVAVCSAIISFLSLFTALLAIGQYIK